MATHTILKDDRMQPASPHSVPSPQHTQNSVQPTEITCNIYKTNEKKLHDESSFEKNFKHIYEEHHL